MVKRERFIVLEGIDGSGKSTQALLLKKWFEQQGKKVFLIHEPGNTKTGKLLKKLVKSKKAEKISKKEWAFIFSKERKENMLKIKKELNKHKIVISDRYYYSTLAYQLSKKDWRGYIGKFLKPDLTVILNIPLKEAMKRIKKKNQRNKLKKAIFEERNILKEVKKKFLNMKNFREVKIIEGNKSKKEVFNNIIRVIKKHLK